MTEHEPREPRSVGPEPRWNESMYVFWRDPTTGVSGWARIAQQPNSRTTSTFACVALPDGTRFRHFGTTDFAEEHRAHGRWAGNGQRFWWDGDVLRVVYESAECSYDLEWRGFYEPVDFHRIMATFGESLGEINAEHVEQSGTVAGRVRVGDEEHVVEALGHRDHSWGYRDTSAILTTRWVIGTVGPTLSWSGATVLLASGALVRTGFVVREGSVVPVAGLDVTLATKEDGLSYTRADCRFDLADGTGFDLVLGDVVVGGVLEVPPWVGIEASAVATVGALVGVGNCETCNNITGGSTPPPVLVTGGATGQGLSKAPDLPRG